MCFCLSRLRLGNDLTQLRKEPTQLDNEPTLFGNELTDDIQ